MKQRTKAFELYAVIICITLCVYSLPDVRAEDTVTDPCTGQQVCPSNITQKVTDPCTGELVCPGDETQKIWVDAWVEGTYTVTIKQCQERKESYTYTVPPSITVSWENLGEPSNSSSGERPEDTPLPQLDSAQWNGSAQVDGSTPKVTVEDYQPLGTTRTLVTKITYKWKKPLKFKACPTNGNNN